MEFERVLFRVHASTLGTLERNRERFYVKPLNACWVFTEGVFVAAMSLLLLSTALHASLETGNCLVPRLEDALRVPGVGNSSSSWRLPRDVVVKISLGSLPSDAKFIPEVATRTRRLEAWQNSSSTSRSEEVVDNATRAAPSPSPSVSPSVSPSGTRGSEATRAPSGADEPDAGSRVTTGDYTLVRRAALLYLDEVDFFSVHDVRVVNVTLSSTGLNAGSSPAGPCERGPSRATLGGVQITPRASDERPPLNSTDGRETSREMT